MADTVGSYRFLLNGAISTAIFGNEFPYKWEKESDSFYFRKKLDGKIKFFSTDYITVSGSTVDFRHTLIVQKLAADGWKLDWAGFFYKTDCDFDADDSVVEIQPLPDDGYGDIKKVLNNEYGLVDLAPIASPITYKIRPVLQVTVIDSRIFTPDVATRLLNIVGTSVQEEILKEEVTRGVLVNDYGFIQTVITVGFDNFYVLTRYLSTLDTFNSVATTDRPEDDISLFAPNHKKISEEISTSGFRVSSDTQLEPTKYGVAIVGGGVIPDNLYYSEYVSGEPDYISIAINISQWFFDQSNWYVYTESINQYELDNSEDTTINEAYFMPDVIQLILSQETDIKHIFDPIYSEFFYNGANPISSDVFDILITPKSNVRNIYYTNPARKSNIRLSEFLETLASTYNVFWHIETTGAEKRFRLEHLSWYENGGTYGPQIISIDLTESLDVRVNKPQAFKQNKYNYLKAKMPQRYEFSWMDNVSALFEGVPINVLSGQINEGQIDRKDAANYTSDIDMIVASEEIALDGFALFEALKDGDVHSLLFRSLEITEGNTFSVQNAGLSYTYLHPRYQRYGMPAENIEINSEATTALSITRNKQQEVTFVSREDINPLNLIRTEIGAGQVDKMEFNIVNNKYKATINHDTE